MIYGKREGIGRSLTVCLAFPEVGKVSPHRTIVNAVTIGVYEESGYTTPALTGTPSTSEGTRKKE